MKCPYCNEQKSGVIDSREADDGQAVRRRRSCHACGKRFTTYERVEEMPLLIIKKDGSRQTFDRQKLLGSMRTACQKLKVPARMLEEAATHIERKAWDVGEREIASRWFGEQVMEALRGLDQVAYVRFASVYRQFKDIGEFAKELEQLRTPPAQNGAAHGGAGAGRAESSSEGHA